jgi:Tol biopolymer transport system component
LYVSQGTLFAQPFDAAGPTVSGEPFVVAQGLADHDGRLHPALSVSETGLLVYRRGSAAQRRLVWRERSGREVGAVGEVTTDRPNAIDLSPDGGRVAANRQGAAWADVWITDVARGVASRFTFRPGWSTHSAPVWSADGKHIAFAASPNDVRSIDLFVKPVDGAADERPLLVSPTVDFPLDWSRDGRFLLYATYDSKTRSDIWVMPMTGEQKASPVLQTAFDETQAQFAPNGAWLAYASNQSGRDEIYLRTFPAAAGQYQVSAGGGTQPRWAPDGNELFYVAPDGKLMSVAIRTTADRSGPLSDAPVALFPTRLAAGGDILTGGPSQRALYAVARDGRFLMIESAGEETPPIAVVQHWEAALKK